MFGQRRVYDTHASDQKATLKSTTTAGARDGEMPALKAGKMEELVRVARLQRRAGSSV